MSVNMGRNVQELPEAAPEAAPVEREDSPVAPEAPPAEQEAPPVQKEAAPEVARAPEATQETGDGAQRERPRRGKRRRRGRGRRPRSQDRGGPSEADLMADLPDDPEELMGMSWPLGLLEVLGSGSGFVRRRESDYAPGNDDIYVGSRIIQKYGLRTGDELMGIVGSHARSGKSPPLAYLALVNDHPPDEAKRRPEFQQLSALHPDEQLVLECGRTWRGEPEFTNRVIDLFCPFGKGQRAMIVAQAKAGKTMVMQAVAEGIVRNHPECHLLILLVEERPEEVTEMEQCGFGEVISSTFDRPAERHVQVAEMTLERARRRVEQGEDVVIILDSITRLARAYNHGVGR